MYFLRLSAEMFPKIRRFTNTNYYYYYHDLNASPTKQWQAVTFILFEHKLQVIFS